jgi:two-component system, OmpR family, response regulator
VRALIVEDHVATAEAVSRVLAREGFTAVTTREGIVGEREIREGAYDLVVLDLRLPDLDGVELCRSLRAEGIWTPILMVSGRGSTTDVVRGLDAGADDYLPKPFAVDELRARVRAVARRRPLAAGATSPSPPAGQPAFALEPTDRTLLDRGRQLELSPRECRLLEVLLHQEGRVCTRTHLMRQVWGREEDAGKLVDVYVGYLRRKLGPDSAASIETVRGVGYRLVLGDASG